MLYQEFKSEYGITEHVMFEADGSSKTGVVMAITFRYRSTIYEIVDDETGDKYQNIPLSNIQGTVKPSYLIDNRLPTIVELENNLFTDRVGSGGDIIFGKPTSILSPPHISSVRKTIGGQPS